MSGNESNESTPNDLKKLTVPQLKALCKERRIPGYSKLAKAALIQKLTECASPPQGSGLPSSARTDERSETIPNQQVPLATVENSTILSGTIDESGSTSTAALEHGLQPVAVDPVQVRCTGLLDTHLTPITGSASTLPPPLAKNPGEAPQSRAVGVTRKKRKGLASSVQGSSDAPSSTREELPVFKVPALPSKVFATHSTGSSTSSVSQVGSALGGSTDGSPSESIMQDSNTEKRKRPRLLARGEPHVDTPISSRDCPALPESLGLVSRPTATQAAPPARKRTVPATTTQGGATRFKPLLINTPYAASHASESHVRMDHSSNTSNTVTSMPVSFLDFTNSPVISLSPIPRPPSSSQRKRIPLWAIVFSRIPMRDLAACGQVSRMFRYAMYLSATYRLKQEFSGLRLAYMLAQYPQTMTDMWPYLRLRERELFERRQMYDASFLSTYFRDRNPISPLLWTSPDHNKQIVIAVRFVLTRLWFTLSIGPDHQDLRSWQVVNVQELAKGEVWSVSCLSPSSTTETFYVLESTCEVIGRPSASSKPSPTEARDLPSLPVRVDWSEYISQRLLPQSVHDFPLPPLFHHIKWTNHEEYDKGISRYWLSRIAGEGAIGIAKHAVAERYVLACVVGNSISGSWMTTQQMAQEFAGLPSQMLLAAPKSQPVNLFLPPHHHVESVHFSTAKKIPLHNALAVVQTPAREYYILKDNGMTVGCEEGGIAEVWQQLLRCNALGVPAVC